MCCTYIAQTHNVSLHYAERAKLSVNHQFLNLGNGLEETDFFGMILARNTSLQNRSFVTVDIDLINTVNTMFHLIVAVMKVMQTDAQIGPPPLDS
jgi:hypothetical protein